MLPKPLTQPHPPLWVAAGSPSTFEKAARMGVGVLCFTTGLSEQLAPLIERYKNLIGDADPIGEYVNDNVMVTSSMLCLDDGARARRIMSEARGHYHQSLLFRYLDTFPRPEGTPVWPELCEPHSAEEMDLAVQMGEWAIGDPDECRRVVQRWTDVGADQLTFGMLSQEVPIDVVLEATDLFGREVIPQFDPNPVHRSTHLRDSQMATTAD